MANTLTNLTPDIYAALDVVSRELVGYIPSVARDSSVDRAAKDQNVRVPVTPSNSSAADITPAMSIPSAGDQTISNVAVTISKSRFAKFSWSGEEQKGVNFGPGFLTLKQGQIAQALRALVNEVETDLASAANLGASRATGTAGTTPFASDLSATANLRKILDDNGAPLSDRHCVINTTAGAKLRTLAQLTKANEAADSTLLRQGTLLDLHGFGIRESAQIPTSTAGTAASATVNNAGYAIGATTLTLSSAGTGTIVAGDVLTFAGDTNQYVVVTGDSDVSNGGTIVIAEPGLRVAMSAATKAITVVAAAARNTGFSRNALVLATRLPALPEEGDMALDRMTVVDDRSGLAFEFAMYPGYRMNVYHVSLAWGTKCIKPEHVALLLG